MAEKGVEKRCKICGKSYRVCYSCEKNHSWRTLADTEDHYYILCVLMEYQTSHSAKKAEKAYQALSRRGINLRDIQEYLPTVQTLMKEIDALTRKANDEETPDLCVPADLNSDDEF